MSEQGLVQDWFRVTEPAPGVVAIAEPLHDEQVHAFLVIGEQRAALIDTGMGIGDIRAVVRAYTDLPVTVLNSHAHFDHIGGNWQFDEIAVHQSEAARLEAGRPHADVARFVTHEAFFAPPPAWFDPATYEIRPSTARFQLNGNEVIDLGGRRLVAIHCPGHSPGGLVFLDEANRLLFSADVAYPAALYAHTPDCHWGHYRRSLRFLASLAPKLRLVLPSHNSDTMDPALLTMMDMAFAAIEAGRTPDALGIHDGSLGDAGGAYEVHRFDGFSVYAPPADVRSAQQ